MKLTLNSLVFSTATAAEKFQADVASVPGHSKTDVTTSVNELGRESIKVSSRFELDTEADAQFILGEIATILIRHHLASGGSPLLKGATA